MTNKTTKKPIKKTLKLSKDLKSSLKKRNVISRLNYLAKLFTDKNVKSETKKEFIKEFKNEHSCLIKANYNVTISELYYRNN